ncbi:MAG TPA: 4-hydroxy-3-methylbut-2-enyl diphosphate reductase [Ruminiclostridium sp.]|jgi:4-hydroxy-3-methylbut-2-enyl diphosphate reductase|nr:bifunctional 4-hydroxy-3-methylbut-2-enyl diphosphate reductase/30S ribosomal protein S1 [Clostridiaceae bacterium]HAA25872.1 4-hydroxy-3-methylbut-2-enyl diphosphate reductase [Ruminiclostridium sp.]
MAKIILAKTAGFCFGVANAVQTAFRVLKENPGRTRIYGELIHNRQVSDALAEEGAFSVQSPDQLEPGDHVVIRAHGIGEDLYNELKSRDVVIHDATCPYVKRIHNLVREKYNEGCRIIIVGDRTHPEVIGINGWCGNEAFVVSEPEEVELLPDTDKCVFVVAQTTMKPEKYGEICDLIKKKFANAIKSDTICNATEKRQREALEISRESDVMIVIGGKNSSNTQKLFEICSENCQCTYKVEIAADIPPLNNNINTFGITAGASTPDWVIKEVIKTMEEILNNKQETENEISFEKAFEETEVNSIRAGEVVKGRIIGYNTSEVFVDLGYKADGTISMEEFLEDPDFDPERDLKEGDEILVYVIKVNDGEGNVSLSKKRVDSIKGMEDIDQAFNNKTPLEATVREVVNGGVVANYKGIRVFIPASQISDRYVKDLNEYLNKKVKFEVVEMSKNKRRVVGSCRNVIEKEKEAKLEEFWNSVDVGQEYTGKVKSLTNFGAFVDLGVVDGLIHVSELSWKKINKPSDVLKIGQTVTVRILGFDREKQKVSLGYRKAEDNPWFNIEEKYTVGDEVTGKIVRLVPFGAFVELEDGVEGLVHISQISNVRLGKPDEVLSIGQEVKMKVLEVNPDLKKISLSIRDVEPIDPVREDEPEAPAEEADVPSEHVEEMKTTIGDMIKE